MGIHLITIFPFCLLRLYRVQKYKAQNPSINPLSHPFITPSIYQSIYPFINQSIQPYTYSSIHQSIHPSIHPHINLQESFRGNLDLMLNLPTRIYYHSLLSTNFITYIDLIVSLNVHLVFYSLIGNVSSIVISFFQYCYLLFCLEVKYEILRHATCY